MLICVESITRPPAALEENAILTIPATLPPAAGKAIATLGDGTAADASFLIITLTIRSITMVPSYT